MTTEVAVAEKPTLEAEDDILAFTHQARKNIVGHLTKKGVPDDVEQQRILLSTLKDMDQSALGRKKIKVEEKQNDNQAAAASLISELLLAATNRRTHNVIDVTPNREIPVLGSDVPPPVLVDGETSDVGSCQETFDSFTQRMNGASSNEE